MKKKLLAVLAFAVSASLAFAQYAPPPPPYQPPPPPRRRQTQSWEDFAPYLSLNFSAPIQWYQSHGDREIDARTVSLGVGIDTTILLTKRVGLHISGDLYFPQKMDGTESIAGVETPISYKLQKEWDTDFGISAFVGPSFALIRASRVLFALAPGFHYYMLLAEKGRDTVIQSALGAGINAEFMFNITDHVFVRAAVDATWDFWGSEEYTSGLWTDYSKIGRAINVTPSIGIGIALVSEKEKPSTK